MPSAVPGCMGAPGRVCISTLTAKDTVLEIQGRINRLLRSIVTWIFILIGQCEVVFKLWKAPCEIFWPDKYYVRIFILIEAFCSTVYSLLH